MPACRLNGGPARQRPPRTRAADPPQHRGADPACGGRRQGRLVAREYGTIINIAVGPRLRAGGLRRRVQRIEGLSGQSQPVARDTRRRTAAFTSRRCCPAQPAPRSGRVRARMSTASRRMVVMEVDDLVDAALVGLDRGEDGHDPAARRRGRSTPPTTTRVLAMAPNLSRRDVAGSLSQGRRCVTAKSIRSARKIDDAAQADAFGVVSSPCDGHKARARTRPETTRHDDQRHSASPARAGTRPARRPARPARPSSRRSGNAELHASATGSPTVSPRRWDRGASSSSSRCLLAVWIVLNVTAYVKQWDPYPFILLNLALSFQAALRGALHHDEPEPAGGDRSCRRKMRLSGQRPRPNSRIEASAPEDRPAA